MAEFSPSGVQITKAIITTHDRTVLKDISINFIYSFSINQSMNDVAWQGELSVLDGANLLEGFPLRGEERLELWIKSFDLGTEVKIKARIYRIGSIQPSSDSKKVIYKMHFCSEASFNASVRKITLPFRAPISTIAKTIFQLYFAPTGQSDYLDPKDNTRTLPMASVRIPLLEGDEPTGRNFVVQPTQGIARVIIPDLSPTDAMHFLCARGYNADSPSQTFRFFETLENYYFCTDEFFLKGIRSVPTLYYAPEAPLTPENAESQIGRIEELTVLSKGIDVGVDVNSGSYRNEVVEVDLVRREFNISQFSFDDARYVDMNGTPRDIADNPHTEQFRKDIFTKENARRFMVFKNYQKPGDLPSNLHQEKHYADIVHNRVSYFHHLNNTSLGVTLKGRLDLRPGQVINLDMKTLNDNGVAVNDSLGGKYLIQTTSHHMKDDVLSTGLKLVKFDWSSGNTPVTTEEIPEDT
jgi:hypothetical protein